MDSEARRGISKFLSFVLRHRPESIDVALDERGWAAVDQLLAQCCAHGRPLTRAELEEVVATNPKQRFAFSADGSRIRAHQGHSLGVELDHPLSEPPELLFHGTVAAALPGVRRDGLRAMQRHHVHLSADEASASQVGQRRGKSLVLRVAAARMWRNGHAFYLTPNGVWLTDGVPPRYISWPEQD